MLNLYIFKKIKWEEEEGREFRIKKNIKTKITNKN